jgi:hypothetical protein
VAVVNAIGIEIFLEQRKLCKKIRLAPKQNMIGKLSPTTSYQPFDERVAPRTIPDRFDFPDLVMVFEIRFPKPVLEERIVVR